MKKTFYIIITAIILLTNYTEVKANFSDDFDNYEIGDIYYVTDGNWATSQLNQFYITNEESQNGENSLKPTIQSTNKRATSKTISTQEIENINYDEFMSFYYYQHSETTNNSNVNTIAIVAEKPNDNDYRLICPEINLYKQTATDTGAIRMDKASSYLQYFNNDMWNKFGIYLNIYHDNLTSEVVCEQSYIVNTGVSSNTKTVRTADSLFSTWENINLKLYVMKEQETGSANNKYYFDNITIGNPNSSENQTRINWISPINTVTASSTFDVTFEYYLNTTTHDPNTFENILINITPVNDTQKGNETYTFTGIQTNTLITETITFPNILSTGYHLGLINFWNGIEENTTCSWWELWCDEENIILGPGDSATFNVATTTIEISNPLERETIMNACGDGMFDGAICRALTWLFLPDNSTATKFLSITENLGKKIPFAFVGLLNDKIKTLETSNEPWNEYEVNLTTSNRYSLGSIKIFNWTEAKEKIGTNNLNTIATWIKNIIWLCFALYVLHRINHITNKI